MIFRKKNIILALVYYRDSAGKESQHLKVLVALLQF